MRVLVRACWSFPLHGRFGALFLFVFIVSFLPGSPIVAFHDV